MISLDTSLADCPPTAAGKRHQAYAERAGRLTIVTYTPPGYQRPPSSACLTVIPTNSRSRLTYALDACRLARQVEPVDLITTQDPFVTGLVGLWLRRTLHAPLLVQNHSHYFGNKAWLDERPLRYRLFALLGKFIVQRADMYRTVNRREREAYLAMGGSPERVAVLPLMTVSEQFAQDVALDVKQAKREQLGLQPHHKVVLWVGRAVKTKRLPLLLQVFQRVAEREPDARLLLVGDLSPANIPEMARELGIVDRVIMPGKVAHDDLPVYYWLSDVLAITSAYEGMPRVLGEAAIAGRPIVGMDSAVGVVEFIEDGVTGYLCPDGDLAYMASRIVALLQDGDLAARVGTAARARALAALQGPSNAEAVVALWEKAVQMGMRR